MRKIVLALVSGFALVGCTTTPNQDGSTTVKLAIPGLSQPAPAAQQQQTVQPAQKIEAPKPIQMAGTPISQTSLAGIFTKNPWAGTSGAYYPKVAITFRDWSRSDCWLADAVIWRSATKSETVNNFNVCANGSLGAAINGAAGIHLFMEQSQLLEHTGNLRTVGPKPPMSAYFSGAPNPEMHVKIVQQLVTETGWQRVPSQVSMWVVEFKK